jgi:signal transduction histidine kinase
MRLAFLEVIVLLHTAFAGVFFFLNWQFPNRFARLFAWCWTIEAFRAAVLLPAIHNLGGMPGAWYLLADELCIVANWCLLVGFADIAGARLPSWLGRAYFWISAPVVLLLRYPLESVAHSAFGMDPARAILVFGSIKQTVLFAPVSMARVVIFLWLYELWKRNRMPGALIAAIFAVPYAVLTVLTPFQFYFSYNPDWIPFVWSARVLGFSIGLVILMFDRQHADLVENEVGMAGAQALARLGSWRYDPKTGEGHWSREMLRLFGFGPSDKPPSYTEFLGRVHPDDWPAFEPGHAGKGDEPEVRVMYPNGEIRWVLIRSQATRGPRGRGSFSGTAQDITERKKLQAQLAQSQKMEVVGQLAAGITHDFNNVLSAIQLQADFLLKDPSLSLRQRETIEELASYAVRGASLTRQLLLFSRQQAMEERRPIDLNATVAAFIPMLQRLVGAHVTIRFEPAPALPNFKADAVLVEQIVMNLVVNARDAMPHGGHIAISTAAVERPAPSAHPGPGGKSGPYARLSVADTGAGMSEEIRKRIFEPFFTTKGPGTGTGLGLTTVANIVQDHGGWIDVESGVGRGSAFHVHLPLAAD